MLRRALLICTTLMGTTAMAATTGKLAEVPLTDVKLTDQFWAPKLETNRTVTVPHNFKECEQTGRIANFARAAGTEKGPHVGLFFNDSDVYKVIEAASYTLATHPDPKLDAYLDKLIATIASAQQSDGYLYTLYTIETPEKRFTNLKDMHELYCAGHLFEAAVAHYRATGKRNLLDVATRLADHIDSLFGPGKRAGVPGHEEIELALFKLADATGDQKYQKLSEYFLHERGRTDGGRNLYGEYHQDTKPLDQFDSVVGHAVRQMYLACAMTDWAGRGDADDLRPALDRMWTDMTSGKLYVTGGVGARHAGEAFGQPYELPNESAYAETCAGIGNALWNHRMNLLTGDAKYADLVELVSYNGMLSGVSLSGDKFFYVNPLASRGTHHRTPWFDCACCPPNVARYLATLPSRAYATSADAIYVNLYAAGEARVARPGGEVRIAQETQYPWDGKVKLTLNPEPAADYALKLRIPQWCEGATVSVNGKPRELNVQQGYATLSGGWKSGDVVELNMPMPVRRVHADPRVKDDAGRVALARGPVVYCAEAVDNGGATSNLILPPDAELRAQHRPDLLGGVTVITGKALAKTKDNEPPKEVTLTAVPYYAWDNREPGEMAVWLAEDPAVATAPPEPTIASRSKPTASRGVGQDNIFALNDRIDPKASNDGSVPRFTWWPQNGTSEWVQYTFAEPATVGAVQVYWFDDVPPGGCRVPASWKVLYQDRGEWKPVKATRDYGTKKDQFNRVTFEPVKAAALRLEVQLKAGYSAGILEWKVDQVK